MEAICRSKPCAGSSARLRGTGERAACVFFSFPNFSHRAVLSRVSHSRLKIMKLIYCDLETFSECNLPKCGAHRYAEDPSTEVLLWGYAIGNEPAKVWDVANDILMPDDLMQALADVKAGKAKTVWHNGMNFDANVLRAVMGIDLPPEVVIDTMVLAYECGLPGALGDLSVVFRLDKDHAKDTDGRRLVQLFCKPQPEGRKIRRATAQTHPEDWKKFVNYCRKDVEAERDLFKRMPKFNVTVEERALQCLDARINNRGMKIDLALARAAVALSEKYKVKLNAKTQELTNGAINSATQTQAMIETIEGLFGIKLKNLQKSEVSRLIEMDGLPEPMKELLRVRLSSAKSSVTKYKALLAATCSDGRLRGTLQFRGASRTGRYAGRLFQPQNLARQTRKAKELEFATEAALDGTLPLFYPDEVPEILSEILRGVITVEDGHRMVVADYSNIEGRVLAWVAGERWKLDAFREYDVVMDINGGWVTPAELQAGTHAPLKYDADGELTHRGHDLYKMAYAKAFGVKPEDVTKPQRQMGKVLELAMGYGGGPGAFVVFATSYGIDLKELARAVLPTVPQFVMDEAVSAYEWARSDKRRLCGLTRDVWLACDSLKRLWRRSNPSIVRLWKALSEACITALKEKRGAQVNCPQDVRIEVRGNWLLLRLPSGRYLCYASPRVLDDAAGTWTYMGIHQRTRKWQRLETYGGKVVENMIQGIAADVLTASLSRLEVAGFHPVLSVHDEVLTECPDTDFYTHERMQRIMCEQLPWSKGLPLAAAGFDSKRYHK